MPFDREQLRLLDATEEVEIETTGVDGTVHRTVIWVVVAGDRPYIRSYRGPNARWYREAGRDPNVTLLVDGRRIPARVVHDDDAATIGRVSDELQRKYPADPATPDMIRPEVLGTTLRVESV